MVERNPIKIDDKQVDKNELNNQTHHIRSVKLFFLFIYLYF